MALSELELRVLGFEAERPGAFPAKEELIRQGFNFSLTYYYLILNELISKTEARPVQPSLLSALDCQKAAIWQYNQSGEVA